MGCVKLGYFGNKKLCFMFLILCLCLCYITNVRSYLVRFKDWIKLVKKVIIVF